MSAFLVAGQPHTTSLTAKVAEVYPTANLQFAENVWLVADSAVTAQEVSEKLNIKPGGISGAIVVRIENYYGFASKNIWEWLTVKIGADDARSIS
jgi:hypothetical protein